MSLTIGILAIGSLYWDKGVREGWRNSRLRMDHERTVMVPIRYGRLSTLGRWRDTYTMVFSAHLSEFGQARVLRCQADIGSLEDLIIEAAHLWAAERRLPDPDESISSNWGCVAILRNPTSTLPEGLVEGWRTYVQHQIHYRNLAIRIEGGELISDSGFLQLPWPQLADGSGPLGFDLILATPNEPTPAGIRSPNDLADAWKRASRERPEDKPDAYFWENRKNGITTFQDVEIESILRQGGGCLSSFGSFFRPQT